MGLMVSARLAPGRFELPALRELTVGVCRAFLGSVGLPVDSVRFTGMLPVDSVRFTGECLRQRLQPDDRLLLLAPRLLEEDSTIFHYFLKQLVMCFVI